MSEPALDLSEIVGLYKEDARRSVGNMRAALEHWDELAQGGPACKEMRKLSHQLRGSGRTYGFHNVTRIGKALEHLTQKLEAGKIPTDARLRNVMLAYVERLAAIFQA